MRAGAELKISCVVFLVKIDGVVIFSISAYTRMQNHVHEIAGLNVWLFKN
jgi:hypothetical protein